MDESGKWGPLRNDRGGPRRVQGIIFDLFGTLVDNVQPRDWVEFLTIAAGTLGVPTRQFARVWSMDTRLKRARGDFQTVDEALRFVCQRLGIVVTEAKIAAVSELRWEYTRRSLQPRQDAVATLETLRARGHRIGLVSDCTAEVPGLWHTTPFVDLIDAPVFSCSAGAVKPDPTLFQSACEALALEPASCVYVGDGGGDELNAAERLGMRSILICARHEEPLVLTRPGLERFKEDRIACLDELLDVLVEMDRAA